MIYKILNYLIVSVWIVMGLFCKTLNLAPRHQEIVARILGAEYASILTPLIGMGELFIAIWILSGLKRTWCVWTQIALIVVMNIIEFFLASDLLLWGRWNSFFALCFAFFIYYNEFILKPKKQRFKIIERAKDHAFYQHFYTYKSWKYTLKSSEYH